MDIMELGAIGELVGGVAVIGSLIYLALQVRQSNDQTRRNARELRASNMREATRELGNALQLVTSSPDRAELFLKEMADFEELGPKERLRFSATVGHMMRLFEQLFYRSYEDSLEPEVWSGFRNQLRDVSAYPGVRTWWPTRSHW